MQKRKKTKDKRKISFLIPYHHTFKRGPRSSSSISALLYALFDCGCCRLVAECAHPVLAWKTRISDILFYCFSVLRIPVDSISERAHREAARSGASVGIGGRFLLSPNCRGRVPAAVVVDRGGIWVGFTRGRCTIAPLAERGLEMLDDAGAGRDLSSTVQ